MLLTIQVGILFLILLIFLFIAICFLFVVLLVSDIKKTVEEKMYGKQSTDNNN